MRQSRCAHESFAIALQSTHDTKPQRTHTSYLVYLHHYNKPRRTRTKIRAHATHSNSNSNGPTADRRRRNHDRSNIAVDFHGVLEDFSQGLRPALNFLVWLKQRCVRLLLLRLLLLWSMLQILSLLLKLLLLLLLLLVVVVGHARRRDCHAGRRARLDRALGITVVGTVRKLRPPFARLAAGASRPRKTTDASAKRRQVSVGREACWLAAGRRHRNGCCVGDRPQCRLALRSNPATRATHRRNVQHTHTPHTHARPGTYAFRDEGARRTAAGRTRFTTTAHDASTAAGRSTITKTFERGTTTSPMSSEKMASVRNA